MDLIQLIGLTSYGTGAGLYVILLALLLTSWQGRLQGFLIVLAAVLTVVWAAAAASLVGAGVPALGVVSGLEAARNLAWSVVLWRLIEGSGAQRPGGGGLAMSRSGWSLIAGFALLYALLAAGGHLASVEPFVLPQATLLVHLALALAGVVLAEQLYRHTPPQHRWTIKYLCFGIGGLFAFDFYMYANGLLFRRIDPTTWMARGFICAMTAPLVAITAARNPAWSVNVYVSKRMLFHSTTVLIAAVYLLLVAVAGYYVRIFGGSWGAVLQNVLVFAAAVALAGLLLSRQLREQLRLFLAKNFYQNKYEYGEEWLKFSERLGDIDDNAELPRQVVTAICELMNAPAGSLWLQDTERSYALAAKVGRPRAPERISVAPETRERLEEASSPIDLTHPGAPGSEVDSDLARVLSQFYDAWLLVPLVHQNELIGLLVLSRSLTAGSYNYEDRDLLRAVGRQAAGFLALLRATERLAQNRQFEAYSRFSAFLIHDLKNIAGQLSMVLANAAEHRGDPAFFDDAMQTVDNAARKMTRVLQQLRERSVEHGAMSLVDVGAVLQAAVDKRSVRLPKPLLRIEQPARIYANADRFEAVVAHFIQNAQEATGADGEITLTLDRRDGDCVITIADNGCGMSADFVTERLFRPFQTTKGNAGMGIGVFEGREFARALGGDVTVDSAAGQGTCFTICIPLEYSPQQREPKAQHA